MAFRFDGRDVVVTGGRGALGRAVVDALVAAGARCHLPVRHDDAGPQARGAAGQGAGPPVVVTAGVDLTDEAAVAAYYAGLPPLWASIHVAGGFAGRPLLETALGDLRQQLDINLVTAFLCAREAVRNMRRAPGAGGRIVNVSSRAALVPGGGSIAYSVAKAGVNMLTATLSAELKPDRILVNAVAPQIIDTPQNRSDMPRAARDNWAQPADIALTILWLASAENTLTTGTILPI